MKKISLIFLLLLLVCIGLITGCDRTEDTYQFKTGELEKYDNSKEMLLKFWVLKEAYAKLTGRGLGNYLGETDFDTETVQIIDGCFVAVLEE